MIEKNTEANDVWFPTEKFITFLRDPLYMLTTVTAAAGTYGYHLTHDAVTVDFLANDLYVFGIWNTQGRFTQSFLNALFNWNHQSRFLTGFLSVVILCLSAILFCIIFEQFLPKFGKAHKVLFSALLISAPIYIEGMTYQFLNACGLGFGFFASALTIYWVLRYIETRKTALIAAGSCLLLILTSWYEAFLLIYVCAVFAVLLLNAWTDEQGKRLGLFFRTGLIFVLPLLLGIAGEYCVQRVLVHFLGTKGERFVQNTVELTTDLKVLRWRAQRYYSIAAIWYLPITLFAAAKAVGALISVLLSVKHRNPLIFIAWLGMHLTNLILQAVTVFQVGYRSNLSFGFYDAFVFTLLFYLISQISVRPKPVRGLIRFTAVFCAVWLVLLQISESSYWYYWDFRRYNEEREVLRHVGYRINADFDAQKPVAFTGSYQFSDTLRDRIYFTIRSQTYPLALEIARRFGVTTILDYEKDSIHFVKLPETGIQNVINWSLTAFGNNSMMLEYIGYEGFKFKGCSPEQLSEAWTLSGGMPKWPAEGSIRDAGEYLIVHF